MDTAVNQHSSSSVPNEDEGADWAAARFIQNVSHQLSGSLNLRRTKLRALHLALPYLGDWAMLAYFDGMGASILAGARDGRISQPISTGRLDPDSGLCRIKRVGRTELYTKAGHDLDEVLCELIPLDFLCAEVAEFQPESVLAVGLNSGGTTTGILVVVKGHGRSHTPTDIKLTEDFGRRVGAALYAAQLYEERAEMAESLQTALRPPELPEYPGVWLAARYRASQERMDIGGDFYDVHGDADDFTVVLGDVCGKGIGAAVLTGFARQTIRTAAHFDRSPGRVLVALNDVLRVQAGDRFISTVCIRLRRPEGENALLGTVAAAGHPPPLLLRADGSVEEPAAKGTVAGIVADLTFPEVEFRLGTRETILLYTDGVDEARGPQGFFGPDRLRRLLPSYAGASPATLCDAVEQHVIEHIDGDGHDDIAVLAIRNER